MLLGFKLCPVCKKPLRNLVLHLLWDFIHTFGLLALRATSFHHHHNKLAFVAPKNYGATKKKV